MLNSLLIERISLAMGAVPINTTGAAVTTPWVDFSKCKKVIFAILTGAWAGGTPAVTLNQAKDNAGGSSKALGFTKYWLNTYGSASTSDPLTATAVVSNTFNLSATANQLYIIEVLENDLDINNGFNHVDLSIASPGSNADLIAVLIIAGDLCHETVATGKESILG